MSTDRETLASLYGLTTDSADHDSADMLTVLEGFRPVPNADPGYHPTWLGDPATAGWVIDIGTNGRMIFRQV